MRKRLLTLGLLAILTGCTKEIHNHYHTKEVAVAQPQPIQEQPVQYSIQKKSHIDEDVCEVLYTTYKQCYGLGIQANNTNTCINTAGELSERVSMQWGDHELGAGLGTICAVACESANRNMSMPSYQEFSSRTCQ